MALQLNCPDTSGGTNTVKIEPLLPGRESVMKRIELSLVIVLLGSIPVCSAQDMSMTLNEFTFCLDITHLKKLATGESGSSKLIDRIDFHAPSNKERRELPDLLAFDFPIKGFKTLGIDKKKKSIYYQRERNNLAHWTESVLSVLSKQCDATAGGVTTTDAGPDRNNKRIKYHQYVDKDITMYFGFPVKWNKQDIFTITIFDEAEKKRIKPIVAKLWAKQHPQKPNIQLQKAPEKRQATISKKKPDTRIRQSSKAAADNMFCSKYSEFGCDDVDITESMKPYKKPQKSAKKKHTPEIVNHYCWRIEDMSAPAFREYHSWATPPKCLRSYYGSNPSGYGAGWHCDTSTPSAYQGKKLENCGGVYY